MPYFIVDYPGERTEKYPIEQELVMVGRSGDAHLQIDDKSVSRVHCELKQSTDGTWLITDMGSRNGTKVNGDAVEQARLYEGDEVKLGRVLLTFYEG